MLGASNVLLKKLDQLKIVWESLNTKDKISCLLNNYFSSVFTLEDIQSIPEPTRIFKGDIDTEGLLISLITSELVEKKFEK